jgi:hypothetical protein
MNLRKGFHMYPVIAMNKKDGQMVITQHPYLSYFPNVFLKSYLGFHSSVSWSSLTNSN